jgi:hypothetical protein
MSEISVAEQVLEIWGASVDPIPTSDKEESDWLAALDGFSLLIEEKIKFENPDQIKERSFSLQNNQGYNSSTSLISNNRISGIIKKAANQLASTKENIMHDARIVWITATGFDAEAKHYQTLATLYGSTKVFEPEKAKKKLKECYFFYDSDFFRFRNHLDGAIVAFIVNHTVTMKLCLNPYSERWQILRDSPFAAKLPNGLIDPVAEEGLGVSLLADTDINRKNKEDILNFLSAKYGVERLLNMDMTLFSAVLTLPTS